MKTLCTLLGLFAAVAVQAQSYSVDWYKIAGGGGTSSGGNFTLSGTIGQHDAGRMSGGNYTLEGGFMAGIVLVQVPGSPLLTIVENGGNGTATISWPLATAGFVLEESPALGPLATWSTSGATIATNGGFKTVTVP